MGRVMGLGVLLVLLSGLAGTGYARREGLRTRGLNLEHWAWVAAAWPAENLTRVDTRALLPHLGTPTAGVKAGIAPSRAVTTLASRFVSWPAWLAVPSERRYRQLHAATPHARAVRTMVLAEVLAPAGLVVLLWLWRLTTGGPLGRLAPSTAMGSARWAGRRELRAWRPGRDGLGFVLGYAGRQLVSLPEKVVYQNILAIGPPGVGKSAALYIPNVLAERGRRALVIVDVKGELVDATLPAVARRHEALVLNFVDPAVSLAYNPLAHIHGYMEAELFARTWVTNTGTSKNDTFWDEMARQLITAAVLHLGASMPAPALADVAAFLCGQDSKLILAAFAQSPSAQAKELGARLLDNLHKNERLAGSVFAGMPLRWSLLQDERIRAVTGSNELDFARFATDRGKPPALYVVLDYTLKEALPPLVACFFTQFFRALRLAANQRRDKQLPRPVLVLLDEFGTVGHIPGIEDDLATMRAARVGCVLAVQAASQIAATYGRDSQQTIMTTCMTKVGFPGMEEDAAWFAEKLGIATVLTRRADSSRKRGSARAQGGTDGLAEHGRPLLTADEVTRLDEEELVVLSGHRLPLRLGQRRWYRDRRLRALAGRRLPDGSLPPLGGPRRATPLGRAQAPGAAEQAAFQQDRTERAGAPEHVSAGQDRRVPRAHLWGGQLEQEQAVDPEQAALQHEREEHEEEEGKDEQEQERRPEQTIYLGARG